MELRYAATGIACACALVALAGCPTVDLGDTPPDIGQCNPSKGEPYFESDIWPKYLDPTDPTKQCTKSGCHNNQDGQSALRFQVDPPDFDANYAATQFYLNCDSPMQSELLTKPLAGTEPHGGGDIFASTSDPAVVDFLAWFDP